MSLPVRLQYAGGPVKGALCPGLPVAMSAAEPLTGPSCLNTVCPGGPPVLLVIQSLWRALQTVGVMKPFRATLKPALSGHVARAGCAGAAGITPGQCPYP